MRILATLLLLTLALPPVADARARPKHARRHRKADKLANMPRGWAWPPTAAQRSDGRRCLAHLDEMGVAWERGPRTPKVTTPVVVPSLQIAGLQLRSRSR